MKTYIYRTLFIGVLVSSYLTHSQIRPNNNRNQDLKAKWKKIRQKKGRGEFLRFNSLNDLRKSCPSCPTRETEFEDFSFNWDNGFHTALNNLALLEKVQVAKLKSWHRKQFNLMKAEIEKQLNTSFNNYNQAKKAFFSGIERENITKNTPVILSKYERLYNSGKRKNRRYLRQLKFLQLRKIELREGNINNSQFSYIEVNGISLKEITLLSTLLKLESNIENAFENQISRNYEYRHTIEKLDYLGSSFERKMFRLKHEYYNGFSEWDKLGLMQFLLNYEHYKDIINCMVCILPDALLKFRNSDMATQPVIEEYAKSSSGYNVSLFDPRYPQIHRFKYQNNMCGGRIDLMAWEADKKAALDALVDDVSTRGLVIESLITELKITDNSQKNWLYSSSNSTEVSNLIDFLQKNRVHGVVAVEAVNFAKEAIDFLKENTQYSFTQYENWFSSFNTELETNPTVVNSNDITFESPLTQQNLPTFSSFLTNFPKRGTNGNYSAMSTSDTYTLVGGSLLNSHINQNAQYNNACALRASRGLLYSGIQIPVLKYNGSQRTQKGGDGKNYILDAVSFNTYMIAKFGETSTKLEGAEANDPVKVAALLDGKNGIYVIVNSNTTTAGYSGHCDIIINGECISNAYTTPRGGVKSIRIWPLN